MEDEDFGGLKAGLSEAVDDIRAREDERLYMVGGEDELGDQHVFMTNDRERAIAAYKEMGSRFANVATNAGLGDALRDLGQR